MDRLLSEVAPSHDSPSSNNSSSPAQPELQGDPDSPGQMIRDALNSLNKNECHNLNNLNFLILPILPRML